VVKKTFILPIKIALCQKNYAKRIRKRAKSEFQTSHINGNQDLCQTLETSGEENTPLHLERIFTGRILFMRNRENEGFRANDAALLLFMVVAVWLWAFFR
jgi:hypothetical protein